MELTPFEKLLQAIGVEGVKKIFDDMDLALEVENTRLRRISNEISKFGGVRDL